MHYIYDFFIQPLVLVYDVIYTILYRIIQQPVVAILALSIIINFLALPLYRKADLLQKEEIDKQKKMKPWLDHIKTHFSGDERFMMTQAYYRIEHYTPLSILKEAGPLALQIPFFMAAYNYISNIPLLETSSFGPINNLLAPDALITIGGFSINILPIIMTIINLISGYTYSKEGPLRQKIQIYVIAAVFLVLLYNSASGLVIYWIMNQIFSLGKNIYYTRGMKEKTKIVVKVVVAVALILYLELTLVLTGVMGSVEVLAGQIVLIICAAVLLITALRMKGVKPPSIITKVGSVFGSLGDRRAISAVLLVEASLVALLGFYIPSSVLSASVVDFIDSSTGTFPFNLLVYPAVVYSGLLLLWMTVILFSRDRKKRRNMLLGLWAFFGVALVNHFFFDPQVGSLYANLLYDGTVKTDLWRSALNIFVCIVAGLFFMILIAKKPKWAKNIAAVIIVVLVGLGTYNIIQINNGVATAKAGEVIDNSSEKAINLSKTGHNVVVMMLDRAIGTYVPYIFDEKPELKEAYKGFVYYPNTVSFGLHTKFGSPGLFGGYEYNPWEFNEQSDRPNVDQHNEALSVMPVLFQQNGYQVTVCDVPFGNYWWNSDLSFYEKYPGIETKHLIGRFLTMLEGDMGASTDFQSRNFIMYGLFRALPLPLKTAIYDNGYYVTLKNTAIVSSAFIDNYSELAALKDITSTSNDDKNVFIMMQNATPHCPTFLNPPNYSLSTNDVVDWCKKQCGTCYDEEFLDANGVKADFKLSTKRLVTEFSEEEKKKTYSLFARHFNIKDTTQEVSPEMILSLNLKKYLKHDVNNEFMSNLSQLFGGNNQMFQFSNALFERAKEKYKKETFVR